ncbi:NUDIX domain-containing protein [Kitasatospora sp. NPDC088548]|uniref:NUDIX domain-containing protein n=1 Tax=Kitasatospora sp. NPDC088548 TaxID=3364075 RepID=UPI0037FD88A5
MNQTTDTPARPIVDVHVLVRDGEKLLLTQRAVYGRGQWHAPSGKADKPGETLAEAAARELQEEVGLSVDPADLVLLHTVIHHQGDGTPDRYGLFYEAHGWTGEPENREPEKCMDVRWFAEHELPEDLIPYPGAGIHGALTNPGGHTFHGWPEQ